ncbi:DNA primase [Flavisphingomonas formosensis]|uniref:DNA primase n=1 Tax=Flavisphingomonas formosensis TaxID=861534 RepID=UPI0012F89882|nr:DNA primase [Sphingomonas formosensis]
MSLSPQFLDELRTRTLLSALIGRTTKLQKAGREFRACCPFHNEKSPSFYVNDEKGFYHCFGCGAHGDAIRWMTDQRGLPFMDAVKELAQAAGMEVPAADPRSRDKAERASSLYDVAGKAAEWFAEQLAGIGGSEARAYIERRGVTPETVRNFNLGFAPDSRGKLKSALASLGQDKLVETGLLIAAEDKEPYDRFRGRLIIPIRDPRGRVIAFGGRIIGQGEPKYLNSPETVLFDKGRTLFNLDRASAASRKSGRLIVVEGYMDVIALDQAGIGEAVAPLGTALTEGQMERLWRLVDLPILCFDGDAAGQKAAIRAAVRALPMLGPGRSLRFVSLPAGQDPDDLIRTRGRAALEALLAEPEPLVDRLWRHELAAEPLTTPEARAGFRRRLANHAETIRDGDVRGQYMAEFRRRFDALYESAKPRARAPQQRFGGRQTRWQPAFQPATEQAKSLAGSGMERLMTRAILAGLLRHPREIAAHSEAIAALPLTDPPLDRLRSVLLDAAFGASVLEEQQLETILASTGLKGLADELRGTNGLAFSFLRSNADSDRAARDLGVAIETLAARPELDAALAAATARLMEAPDEAGFAEQRRLRAAREEADRSLAALAQPQDGAAY